MIKFRLMSKNLNRLEILVHKHINNSNNNSNSKDSRADNKNNTITQALIDHPLSLITFKKANRQTLMEQLIIKLRQVGPLARITTTLLSLETPQLSRIKTQHQEILI